MTDTPPLGDQHDYHLQHHRDDVAEVAAVLRHLLVGRGRSLEDVVGVAEAALATLLQERGIDTRTVTDFPICCTVLLSGEVATDLLPHLKAAA